MLHPLQEASQRGVAILTYNPLRECGLERFLNPARNRMSERERDHNVRRWRKSNEAVQTDGSSGTDPKARSPLRTRLPRISMSSLTTVTKKSFCGQGLAESKRFRFIGCLSFSYFGEPTCPVNLVDDQAVLLSVSCAANSVRVRRKRLHCSSAERRRVTVSGLWSRSRLQHLPAAFVRGRTSSLNPLRKGELQLHLPLDALYTYAGSLDHRWAAKAAACSKIHPTVVFFHEPSM